MLAQKLRRGHQADRPWRLEGVCPQEPGIPRHALLRGQGLDVDLPSAAGTLVDLEAGLRLLLELRDHGVLVEQVGHERRARSVSLPPAQVLLDAEIGLRPAVAHRVLDARVRGEPRHPLQLVAWLIAFRRPDHSTAQLGALVLGRRADDGGGVVAGRLGVPAAVLAGRCASPSELLGDDGRRWDALFAQALGPEPTERPATAREFLARFEDAAAS